MISRYKLNNSYKPALDATKNTTIGIRGVAVNIPTLSAIVMTLIILTRHKMNCITGKRIKMNINAKPIPRDALGSRWASS
jgi:hypothetical protein